jgi:hypothetical protein
MLTRPIRKDDQQPWNKGLLVGQKKRLQPKHVWSIRIRLEIARKWRDALFNLAIDSKLRACDLVKIRLDEVCSDSGVRDRATIVQKKTGRPVQCEITEQTRVSVETWLRAPPDNRLSISLLKSTSCTPSPIHPTLCPAGNRWIESIGLESASYGTHSM